MRRKVILIFIVISMLILAQGDVHATYVASPQLDLRAFPVLPTINGSLYLRARTLVLRGKRTGNRLNVFSKIGDSITAWTYFLNPVGAGAAQLGGYDKLQ